MAEPTRLPLERIDSIAEAAAKAFSYTKDFDINRVIKDLGGRIVVKDFWENAAKTGSLVVLGLRDFEIFVPKHTTSDRNKFTVAHELGHYILHYLPDADPRVDTVFEIDRYGDTEIETEANLFASAFLMPKKQFTEEFKKFSGDPIAIANKFGVSELAAQARLDMLGLGSGRQSQAAGSFTEVPST